MNKNAKQLCSNAEISSTNFDRSSLKSEITFDADHDIRAEMHLTANKIPVTMMYHMEDAILRPFYNGIALFFSFLTQSGLTHK